LILVTVGAYDLPFNRLVMAIDALVVAGLFTEDVFIQIGHSVVPTSAVRFERFLSFQRINELADEARLIISQGGPGSIMLGLTRGKVPIVVPRQKRFGEMVDDHQVLFVQKLAEDGKVLPVYDVSQLAAAFKDYSMNAARMQVSAESLKQHAERFAERLDATVRHHYDKRTRKLV